MSTTPRASADSASSRAPWPRRLGRRIGARLFAGTEWFRGPDTLDEALEQLNAQLGLGNASPLADGYSEALLSHREPATIARPSAELARTIIYAPDMDGQADPGEVVWIPVQLEGENTPLRERAVVVVGRHNQNLLGMLISTREEHADQPEWISIGSGSWNIDPKPSWVRVDRVLEVPESGIRRAGAVMPRKRFDLIASRLRADYGWN
nr:type II toxin-antitoxin system PemK/MazF family toxin [Corynebacterium lactis]